MNPDSPLREANQRMTIIQALSEVGVDIMDFSVASLKVYCPFGEMWHGDGGRTKAMRVYPGTNSAWCFDCQIYFTPTKLLSMDKDITEEEAAQWILEKTGYVAPDYASRWQDAVADKVSIDKDALAETLKVYCARIDKRWEEHQLDPEISTVLSKCLQALRGVNTSEDVTKWLTRTKEIMSQTLKGPT